MFLKSPSLAAMPRSVTLLVAYHDFHGASRRPASTTSVGVTFVCPRAHADNEFTPIFAAAASSLLFILAVADASPYALSARASEGASRITLGLFA